MYESQPHIYALAEDTFRNLMNTKEDQVCMEWFCFCVNARTQGALLS